MIHFSEKKVSIHLSIYECHPYSRGQANLLCIVPIFTDDDFRHSVNKFGTHLYKHSLNTSIVPMYVLSLSAQYGSAGCSCQSCYRVFATEIWSRETGSVVPSRASPLILHTRAESVKITLAFRDGVQILYYYQPSSSGLFVSP